MATHRHIDKLCCIVLALTILLTVLFMNGASLGLQASASALGYETRLFDTSHVHTIDIVMNNWDEFIEGCEDEQYALCAVVIDGESYKNVGIRAKGNTSLSSVSQMNSDRYSFKIEFDHYDSTKSYYGLDKLSLNNIIQDNTYMKDYLVYRLMSENGVASPLCSFVYITVNGEDWGLYLAVEGVEEAFLERNYGSDYGELYKPDSTSFGGGRGNGRDFQAEGFTEQTGGENIPPRRQSSADESGAFDSSQSFSGPFGSSQMPPGNAEQSQSGQIPSDSGTFIPSGIPGGQRSVNSMGSSDVKLQYIDDNPDSYANIFDNAKTDITAADQARLIASLKALSRQESIESVVNVEEVLRYFVVHNFVCNGDSYTGSMVHNYYLYENDGQLSMIPWDYNLAFGGFQSADATATVNEPIDSPVSGSSTDDRPMVAWIFADETYTALYHCYFAEFLSTTDFTALIEESYALIAPYVEKDPTKFCTYEGFEAGVDALKTFCTLRAESVAGQLAGTIPSTSEGQSADRSNLVDAGECSIAAMGTMGNAGGFQKNPAPAEEASEGNIPAGSDRADEGAGSNAPTMPDKDSRMQSGNFPTETATSGNGNDWLWLLILSVLVLGIGLLIAWKFRR